MRVPCRPLVPHPRRVHVRSRLPLAPRGARPLARRPPRADPRAGRRAAPLRERGAAGRLRVQRRVPQGVRQVVLEGGRDPAGPRAARVRGRADGGVLRRTPGGEPAKPARAAVRRPVRRSALHPDGRGAAGRARADAGAAGTRGPAAVAAARRRGVRHRHARRGRAAPGAPHRLAGAHAVAEPRRQARRAAGGALVRQELGHHRRHRGAAARAVRRRRVVPRYPRGRPRDRAARPRDRGGGRADRPHGRPRDAQRPAPPDPDHGPRPRRGRRAPELPRDPGPRRPLPRVGRARRRARVRRRLRPGAVG